MMKEQVRHDFYVALGAGLILAAIALFVDWRFSEREEDRSDREQRLEDLRFLRDVSTRQEGPMPFRNLDLHGMNLSGLRFPCRDDEAGVEGGCGVRADFTDANLSDAVMRNMDLTGADFTRADLQGADLGGSLLTDADLTAARNLGAAELAGVCYVTGNAVIWPSALGMPESMTGDPNSPLCNPGM